MSRLLELAGVLSHADYADDPVKAETQLIKRRMQCLTALKDVFEKAPPVEDVMYELITLLLILPVYERIYVQRALRPLAQKLNCNDYLADLSRALQETDAWVDLNILTDKGRRSLPDMGLEITPEFKLP